MPDDSPPNPHADGPEQLPEAPGPPEIVDPYAERRVAITAEQGIHKTWMPRAREVNTIEEFTAFHDELMHGYAHDYDTLVHAIAALSVAAACLGINDGARKKINGNQAGAVMWEWLAGWGTGPANIGRMLDFEQMLFPQYARRFTQLGAGNWAFLRKRAAELLAFDDAQTDDTKKAPPRFRDHWTTIVNGIVPFGWSAPDLKEGAPDVQN